VPEELADRFTAIDGGSAELETLNFLNALVYLYKPRLVLETGTGQGFTTLAIATALLANGGGHVHSVELDPSTQATAAQRIARYESFLVNVVTLHRGDSRQFIEEWAGAPFDFVFFDSLIAFRHTEFEMLQDRGLLAPQAVCVFHDTSRRRGAYYQDFNPEMIASLDGHSLGNQWLESDLSRGLRVIKLG
jgi:predicted O-methyltransferase YrrM